MDSILSLARSKRYSLCSFALMTFLSVLAGPIAIAQTLNATATSHSEQDITTTATGSHVESGDGGAVALDVAGLTRRQAIEQLFAGRAVVVRWSNKGFAEQAVQGRFNGTVEEVARRLLARSNYVIVYDSRDGERRLARIDIFNSEVPQPTHRLQ